MGAMFISARAEVPARSLARALDAALAFAAHDGPLTGVHLKLTAHGLVVLGSDGAGVCATTVPAENASGLAGRWRTLSCSDAERIIDWIRVGGHEHLSFKDCTWAISLVPATGTPLQHDVTTTEAAEGATDVRDDLLRSMVAIAHDWAPTPAVPAGLLLRLADVQHLGSGAAPVVQLVPTANGWAGSIGEGAAVFAYTDRRIPCDAPGVLAHVAATGTKLAAAGPTILGNHEADVDQILSRKARR